MVAAVGRPPKSAPGGARARTSLPVRLSLGASPPKIRLARLSETPSRKSTLSYSDSAADDPAGTGVDGSDSIWGQEEGVRGAWAGSDASPNTTASKRRNVQLTPSSSASRSAADRPCEMREKKKKKKQQTGARVSIAGKQKARAPMRTSGHPLLPPSALTATRMAQPTSAPPLAPHTAQSPPLPHSRQSRARPPRWPRAPQCCRPPPQVEPHRRRQRQRPRAPDASAFGESTAAPAGTRDSKRWAPSRRQETRAAVSSQGRLPPAHLSEELVAGGRRLRRNLARLRGR